jgi:DNA-binding SARP family transcriptional activator
MDVRVLGHVEAGNGARAYALGGPTQRRVFAALVARRGEVVDVSALVEVCWPTASPPDRADHNIRTYVHRLRNALEDEGERLETVGTGYRLRF